MKSMRKRLVISIVFTILVSSLFAVSISSFIMAALQFFKLDPPVILGIRLSELITPILMVICCCVTMSVYAQSLIDPIMDVCEATKKVAEGNFDSKLDIKYYSDEEFLELAENFNIMVDELKSNEYLHKNFISNVSHEFKTPVAIISGYTKLIDNPATTNEERSEYCAIINAECEKLTNLSKNLLELSRLDNAGLLTDNDKFKLNEQILDCVIALEPKWVAKDIDFETDLEDITYIGSETLLQQVWTNLIDNAIKFSGKNSIITIRLHETDAYIVATIEDKGIGMDEETVSRIFERFYQGDTSHKEEGNGLGLAIVKSIVEHSNGKIEVSSTPGRGTAFEVYLFKPMLRGLPENE